MASAILDVSFTQPIPQDVQRQIVSTIWGPASNTTSQDILQRRSEKLKTYFEYYHNKAYYHEASQGYSCLKTHKELLFFISLLKANPKRQRQVLCKACELFLSGDTAGAAAIAEIPSVASTVLVPLLNGREPLNIDTALAVAVRTMLAINVSPKSGPNGYAVAIGQSDVIWDQSQTLLELVDCNFPKLLATSTTSETPVRLETLRARSMKDHLGIKIEWTRHFPDHLKLDIGTKSKSLKVFELASLLEVSCSATKEQQTSLAASESLKFGCLPPALLHETQRTLELLFPTGDWSWLLKEMSPRKTWGRSKRPGLDSRLYSVTSSGEGSHNMNMGLDSITNLKQLVEKYPYWATRLYAILVEVDNPTAISWFGRWSERRKAARHTFSLTYLGIVIAILFGMAATGLAAVSVWISYCDWQGDISRVCRTSPPVDEQPAQLQ